MSKTSPLRREGSVIFMGKTAWKIEHAHNAIDCSDQRIIASLEAPTRIEMASWEAATLLGGLIAETARWSGYPTLHTPVIHVERQNGVPCIWWDALEQTTAGDTAPVIHKPR